MNLIVRSFLSFAIIAPSFVFGQELVSIKITDSISKEIIANANLSINKLVYYPSNENGIINFDLKNIKRGDSLYISCIGYFSIKFVYDKAILLPQEIVLSPLNYQLKEINISNRSIKSKEIIIGTKAFSISEYLTRPNNKYALYINNNERLSGNIKELRIHMRNGAKSIDMPFKIKLFSRKPNTRFPDKELIEEIITCNLKRKSWYTLDISHLGIRLPKDGFFIVFETMPNEYYSKLQTKIHGWTVSRVPGIAFTTFPKAHNKDNYSLINMGSNWISTGNTEFQMQAKILLDN